MQAHEAGATAEQLHPNMAEHSLEACCPLDLPTALPPEHMRKLLAVLRRVLVAQALRELEGGAA